MNKENIVPTILLLIALFPWLLLFLLAFSYIVFGVYLAMPVSVAAAMVVWPFFGLLLFVMFSG